MLEPGTILSVLDPGSDVGARVLGLVDAIYNGRPEIVEIEKLEHATCRYLLGPNAAYHPVPDKDVPEHVWVTIAKWRLTQC